MKAREGVSLQEGETKEEKMEDEMKETSVG